MELLAALSLLPFWVRVGLTRQISISVIRRQRSQRDRAIGVDAVSKRKRQLASSFSPVEMRDERCLCNDDKPRFSQCWGGGVRLAAVISCVCQKFWGDVVISSEELLQWPLKVAIKLI